MLRKIETKKVKNLSEESMSHVLAGATCPIACSSCENCGSFYYSSLIFFDNRNTSSLIEPTI